MNNSDERDYAEEAANLRHMREEYADDIREEEEQKLLSGWISDIKYEARRLVEKVAKLHHSVASSEYRTICAGDSEVYLTTQAMLKAAIRTAYPDRDSEAIYGFWIENGESVAYNANIAFQHELIKCFKCREDYMRLEMREVDIIGRKRIFCPECFEWLNSDDSAWPARSGRSLNQDNVPLVGQIGQNDTKYVYDQPSDGLRENGTDRPILP